MTSVYPLHNSRVGGVVYFAVPEHFRTAVEKLTGNLASPTPGNFGGALFTHGLANGASGLHLDPLAVTGKSRGDLVVCLSGGPAVSYAASVLAREGISVTVLESAKFPWYHVGESLIPSVRQYMRFIGADENLPTMGL
ncbi:hypothetical protein B0H14DRAFT_2648559 [Mycena olivaceomarginata]|nr:hypothetical protein B0H14DRAFT_2648559 [Mycena olivaceomarginata]